MGIRWRAILIVSGIILTLLSIFLYVTIVHEREVCERLIAERHRIAMAVTKNVREQTFDDYQKRIGSIARNRKNIIAAFAERDREKLEKFSVPIFNILHKENSYLDAFFFVLPDNRKFFCAHLPDNCENDVTTESLLVRAVNQDQEEKSGYEVDRRGLFYRIVRPVYTDDEFVGVMVLGIRAEQLLSSLRGVIGKHVYLAVKEEELQRAAMKTTETVPLGNYQIIGSEDGILSSVSDKEFSGKGTQRVAVDGKTFIFFSNLVLPDFSGREVAKIIMALDVTDEVASLKKIIFYAVALTLFLLLVSFFVLHFSFGKLINRIIVLNKSLEASNLDLEKKVKKRTENLQKEIEERQKTQQQLKMSLAELEVVNVDLTRKNSELDEFTYVASHDLQEPLRKLVSFSDLLRKDLGDDLPDRAATDLSFITDASLRMQNLVQALLDLSRSGRFELKMEVFPLRHCVEQAIAAVDLRVKETGATIVIDSLPDIYGDAAMLTQVYQNLLGNALKFVSGNHPEVHITMDTENGQPVFGVKDNGIGIRPEYTRQIFTPFKRLHGRDEYEGAGIGLSICRKIIERHGGVLWVESEYGKGTHFKFTLANRGDESAE
ncbi:MAG: hypothetical protein KQH63_03670 [Desulfobulbaceae bacterium]|nr:hypothetical protein [Desulfobulbaceae bacterium]